MNIALHGKNLNKKKLLVLEAIIENIRSNEINIYTSKELKQNLTNCFIQIKKLIKFQKRRIQKQKSQLI